MPPRLPGSIVQIHGDDLIQLLHFLLEEIVFCDGYISLYDFTVRSIFPGGQAHIRLGMVGAIHNDLRRCAAMGRIVHFVLDGGKEILRNFAVQGIVNRRGVDVSNLLVEAPLACPDFLDLGEQVVEIILIEDLSVDQPGLVQHIPLLRECLQYVGGPLTELRGPLRVDPVAHSDDGGQGVELISVRFSIVRNLCKKCTS